MLINSVFCFVLNFFHHSRILSKTFCTCSGIFIYPRSLNLHGEASSGLGPVAMQAEIPVAFGVLTTENIEQAIERAGTKAGNKGAEAALTALEMVNLLQQIDAA